MRRASFEKFTLGGAVILTALMAVSADASAQTLINQISGQFSGHITEHITGKISDWVETGQLFKGAAIASAFTFFGIKFMCSSENTL